VIGVSCLSASRSSRCTVAASVRSAQLLPNPTGRAADRSFRAAGRAGGRGRRGADGGGADGGAGNRRADAVDGDEIDAVRAVPLATQSLAAHLPRGSGRRTPRRRQNRLHRFVCILTPPGLKGCVFIRVSQSVSLLVCLLVIVAAAAVTAGTLIRL